MRSLYQVILAKCTLNNYGKDPLVATEQPTAGLVIFSQGTCVHSILTSFHMIFNLHLLQNIFGIQCLIQRRSAYGHSPLILYFKTFSFYKNGCDTSKYQFCEILLYVSIFFLIPDLQYRIYLALLSISFLH